MGFPDQWKIMTSPFKVGKSLDGLTLKPTFHEAQV